MEKLKDLEFLKDLQKRMQEQEHDCQAYPRFWAIRHTVKNYNCEDGEPLIYKDGGESCYYDKEDLKNLLETLLDDVRLSLDEFLENNDLDISVIDYDDFDSFSDFINEHFEADSNVGYYREEHEIVDGTFFLTKAECKEHIRKNYYHYKKEPHTYAMSVWRNPDLEKVMDILHNFDFDSLINKIKED